MAINRQRQVRRITDDQIEAMLDDARPSRNPRHMPSTRAVRQVMNEIAFRQRPRKGDASGEYCDDTAGQIAAATGLGVGTVKDALAVLASSGWVPIIRREVRHEGRQSGCHRYLAVISLLGLDDGDGTIPPPAESVAAGNPRIATGLSRVSRRDYPATPGPGDRSCEDLSPTTRDRAPAATDGGAAPDLAAVADEMRGQSPQAAKAAAILDRVNARLRASAEVAP
jgi:hypothetical protein